MWSASAFSQLVLLLRLALRAIGSPSSLDNHKNTGPEEPRIVELQQRAPAPVSTWTSFITITLTTTLGIVPTVTTSTPTHTPIPVTVPAPTISSGKVTPSIPESSVTLSTTGATSIRDSAGSSSSVTISHSSTSAIASQPTPTVTLIPGGTTVKSITASSVAILPSKSTESARSISTSRTFPTSFGNTTFASTTIMATAETTTSPGNNGATSIAPHAGTNYRGLDSGQIAAVIASTIAFVVFILLVGYLLRDVVIRHRQKGAERRQNLGEVYMAQHLPAAGSPGMYTVGAESRSAHGTGSLQENEIRIVIQPLPKRPAVWNRGLWPSPPGYTERHTFFSGRSTTTEGEGGSSTDHGQWSLGTEQGSNSQSQGTQNT
ncbi:uncharacterized protein JN550_013353 [Neoarthrinium moseri]|uniref:uncharacterized protein n=1 Tax=Neoarthrinium moseri TaxID=1658444 RepID=UPI001FDD01D9|nr:uncharacterized protein JN550_013353 [Neoarthrinium moseri]KAI1857270.1 hypothetical protein JN550_013353 [Neoarthrinium moseri]